MERSWGYLAVFREIDFQGFSIVLEAEGCHSEEDVLAVDSLSLLLLAFLRS